MQITFTVFQLAPKRGKDMPATLSRKNNLLALLVLLLPFSLSTGQDLDQAVVGPQEER